MILTTSINPNPIHFERQKEALESWIEFEKQIYSVNHETEIENLKLKFPYVKFISTKKSAYKDYNKHYIFVDDIINKTFENCTTDKSIFLLNSDIILSEVLIDFKQTKLNVNRNINNSLDWFEYLSENSLICFKRFDLNGSEFKCWTSGNDGFIINRKYINLIHDAGFVIGQSFWDWWLPMLFFTNNLKTWTFDKPFLIHKLHERQHDENQWIFNFTKFKDLFSKYLEKDEIKSLLFELILNHNSRTCNNFDIIL